MDPALDTGDAFGAYRLGDLVGRGGMGVVRRAEHMHLGRVVALKLLAPELTDNAEFRDRFLRESRLAAALDHASVVTVYDAGEVDGVLYLAMRFVPGTDLASLIAARGPLPPADVVGLLDQVAAALDTAHAAGLVHRDVKPGNVLIDGDRAFLTDFGLTKPTTSTTALTATGVFLGTIDYAAPEQISGSRMDGRTDVYALGGVLHECLTASRPFPREPTVAVLYAHLHDPPPRPSALRPELPAALDAVVEKAMAKRPSERYATCAEMIAAARAAIVPPTRRLDNVAQVVGAAAAGPPAQHPPPPPPAEPPPPPPPPPPPGPPLAARQALAPGPQGLDTHAIRTPPARRPRGLLIAAALLALVAVAAVLALVLGGGDQTKGTTATPGNAGTAPPDNSASTEPRVAGSPIHVGSRPFGVSAGKGILWVANNDDDTATRVGEDGNVRTDVTVGDGPFGVTRDDEAVWVANSLGDSVTRIDITTGKAGKPIPVGSSPFFVAADGDKVYVSNGGSNSIMVIDAATGKRAGGEIFVGPNPRGIAVGAGAIWVANKDNHTVSRVVNGKEERTIDVGDNPVSVAVGGDAVWVTGKDDGTVTRIDTTAKDFATKTIDVGKAPFGIAFGEGFVWVAVSGQDKVVRLDPATGEVVGEPIPIPGQPVIVTIGDGSVWVTANDAGTVTRIAPGG